MFCDRYHPWVKIMMYFCESFSEYLRCVWARLVVILCIVVNMM